MIVYRKVNGRASDLRYVPDGYTPSPEEIVYQGDTLPDLASLHDAPPPSAPVHSPLDDLRIVLLSLVQPNSVPAEDVAEAQQRLLATDAQIRVERAKLG